MRANLQEPWTFVYVTQMGCLSARPWVWTREWQRVRSLIITFFPWSEVLRVLAGGAWKPRARLCHS